MPNYSLVANSTFQPFTYQELMLPIERQNQYFEKLAQEYDNISKQADVLEAMGKNDRDKESGAYSRYKSYSDALRNEADNLYRFGLNTESRQRLTDIRRRYNTDIVPIQNAWNKREQEADLQMKAQLQNPSLMFTRDARNTNLDDYVNNPTGGYGVINGANITAQMSAMAKNLEKQILNSSGRREDIDPYTYNYIRKYGLTTDMIRDWRNNPTLSKMFNQVMEANGVTPEALKGSVNAQNIIDKSTGYAEMGMWSAVGEDKAQQVENYGARLEAQAQKEIDVARAKAAEEAGNGSGDIGTPRFDTRNVRTAAEQEKIDEDNNAWDTYGTQYFYKDANGLWHMNNKGKKLYAFAEKYSQQPSSSTTTKKKMIDPYPEITSAQKAIETESTPAAVTASREANQFKKFVDRMGLSGMANGRPGPAQTGNINAMLNRRNNVLDTNTAIEYTKRIGSTNYDNVIGVLNSVAKEGEVDSYERTGKNGNYSYQRGKDKQKVSELTTSDIKSAQMIYGDHGDFLEVKLKDGSTIMQPLEILSNTYSAVVGGNRGNIARYRRAKKQGYEAVNIGGRNVSLDDLINEELNNYGDNLISAIGVNEVEPIKVKQNYYGTR